MPTKTQIQLLQIARRQLGLEEQEYRFILKTAGKVESSKLLSQFGYENVMAAVEHRGFRTTGKPDDYWRNLVELRGRFASSRQVNEIERLRPLQRYEVPALCARFSQGRTPHASKLTPREAHAMIEMMKAAAERETPAPPA